MLPRAPAGSDQDSQEALVGFSSDRYTLTVQVHSPPLPEAYAGVLRDQVTSGRLQIHRQLGDNYTIPQSADEKKSES